LLLIQSHAATTGKTAADYLAFETPERVPLDPFLGRRILAWIEEREQRRQARLARKADR
jgi:hypothetical protein